MKAFIKNHITLVLVFLFILFMFFTTYLLFIQLPYSNHQNNLISIRAEIIEKNNYQYANYFNKHVIGDTYYILQIEENQNLGYVAFDKNKEYQDEYFGDLIAQEEVLSMFSEKYQKETTDIEVGYDTGIFVYVVTYQDEDNIIYAYYRVDNGEFVKGNQL